MHVLFLEVVGFFAHENEAEHSYAVGKGDCRGYVENYCLYRTGVGKAYRADGCDA